MGKTNTTRRSKERINGFNALFDACRIPCTAMVNPMKTKPTLPIFVANAQVETNSFVSVLDSANNEEIG